MAHKSEETPKIQTIQASQYISLRLMISAPWYVTNNVFHKDLKIQIIEQLTKKFYIKFHKK